MKWRAVAVVACVALVCGGCVSTNLQAFKAQTEAYQAAQRRFNTNVWGDLNRQNGNVIEAIRELQVVVFPEEFAAAGTTEPKPEPEPETEKE